jgi:UDP-glucose 4-epimerase
MLRDIAYCFLPWARITYHGSRTTEEATPMKILFIRGTGVISSATVYEKPPSLLPISETTPLGNPYWTYAANKIACERLLQHAYRSDQFPATIARPSHL